MIVINLFAGPSSGKSTTSAFLFYYLKSKNKNVELVREYAKDVVYEGSYHKLQNQIYVTAKQYKRLKDIEQNKKENVNLVVTDSPLRLGEIYCKNHGYFKEYLPLLHALNNEFTNINVLVNRVKPYNPYGRMQTEEESDQITKDLTDIIKFDYSINGDTHGQLVLAELLYERFGSQI